jgi:hypothetical protein
VANLCFFIQGEALMPSGSLSLSLTLLFVLKGLGLQVAILRLKVRCLKGVIF